MLFIMQQTLYWFFIVHKNYCHNNRR